MSYILTADREEERLDMQSKSKEFSLESELKGVIFHENSLVLDAGCGSGVFCRHLEESFPNLFVHGCDLNERSLSYAKNKSLRKETKFFEHDISQNFENKYDYIFNRLVGHHLKSDFLQKVITNFHRNLVSNGKLIIVDLDGMFVNLGTTSLKLQEMIKQVNAKFPGNLVGARYIPSMMDAAGFKKISWRIETLDFHGENRAIEVLQWKERFQNSFNFYVDVFGSAEKAHEFHDLYVSEAAKEFVPMFYNKFIIQGEK